MVADTLRLVLPRNFDDLDVGALPQYLTAGQCEQINNYYFGRVGRRTIRESWPLEWHIVNGTGVTAAARFLTEARRRFDTAPISTPGKLTRIPAGVLQLPT